MTSTPLFASNRGCVKLSEQECFVVRATSPGWSNPVYYETTELWTCYLTEATVFKRYEAAEQIIEELRSRPPLGATGASLFADGLVLEVATLAGQLRRNAPPRLRRP